MRSTTGVIDPSRGASCRSRTSRAAPGASRAGSSGPGEPAAHATTGNSANANATSAACSAADARGPKTTAKLRRPTRASCAASRWLLAASTAAASAPQPSDAADAGVPTAPVSIQSVPQTATMPKNASTVASPNGVQAIGRGPPM